MSASVADLEREVASLRDELSSAEDRVNSADNRLSAAKRRLEVAKKMVEPSSASTTVKDWLDRQIVLGLVAREEARVVERLIEDIR